MLPIVQDVIGGWTAMQIHDTVAAIARQPAYAIPVRQSLLGRLVRWLFARVADLIALLGGSRGARVTVIVAVAIVVAALAGRFFIAKRIELRRRTAVSLRAVGSARRDYWNLAEELAAGGDALAACHAVYLAVLDSLARAGVLSIHPSKTPGDYARELHRRRAAAASDFRAFVRQFEAAVFSSARPEQSTYTALRRAGERVVAQRAAA